MQSTLINTLQRHFTQKKFFRNLSNQVMHCKCCTQPKFQPDGFHSASVRRRLPGTFDNFSVKVIQKEGIAVFCCAL